VVGAIQDSYTGSGGKAPHILQPCKIGVIS